MHVRSADLVPSVLPFTAKTFGRALIMPNLRCAFYYPCYPNEADIVYYMTRTPNVDNTLIHQASGRGCLLITLESPRIGAYNPRSFALVLLVYAEAVQVPEE